MVLLFFSFLFPHPIIAIEPFEEAERKGPRDPFTLELDLSQDSFPLSKLANNSLLGLGPSWAVGHPFAELPWF